MLAEARSVADKEIVRPFYQASSGLVFGVFFEESRWGAGGQAFFREVAGALF